MDTDREKSTAEKSFSKNRNRPEQLRTYDYVVANPPFSDKTWTTGLTPSKDPFQRFAWGEPPAKQGDSYPLPVTDVTELFDAIVTMGSAAVNFQLRRDLWHANL
jgi:hypothetical protein